MNENVRAAADETAEDLKHQAAWVLQTFGEEQLKLWRQAMREALDVHQG